jgi:hypothetical protein
MPGASGFGDGFTIALTLADTFVQGHNGPVFHLPIRSFPVREHLRVPGPLDLLRRPELRADPARPDLTVIERPDLTTGPILTDRAAACQRDLCFPGRLYCREPESQPKAHHPDPDRKPNPYRQPER